MTTVAVKCSFPNAEFEKFKERCLGKLTSAGFARVSITSTSDWHYPKDAVITTTAEDFGEPIQDAAALAERLVMKARDEAFVMRSTMDPKEQFRQAIGKARTGEPDTWPDGRWK